MPLYQFKNKETGEIVEKMIPMSELDQFKEDNPHLEKCLSAPGFGDPWRLGITKPDNGFRDLLKETKKSHHGSTINTF